MTGLKIKIGICAILFIVLQGAGIAKAQAKQDDSLAYRLLDNAFGKDIESGNAGIWFESIAYGIKDPKGIFSLPVYQVIKGGFLFMDGKKYEMQLGIVKALSDGKIMVMVDESSKMMYVDSVRTSMAMGDSMPDVNKLMEEIIGGEGTLGYAGMETVNGKRCHKIKASVTDAEHTHVYYWVEEGTGKIYLMAEWQNGAYNVYLFRSVGKAPKGHEYTIYLPEKEIDTYHGYTVIDNRFITIHQLK